MTAPSFMQQRLFEEKVLFEFRSAPEGITDRGDAWSPDGERYAVADPQGAVRILDGRTGELIAAIPKYVGALPQTEFNPNGCRNLAWNPDGRSIAVTGPGQDVEVYDAADGQLAMKLQGHRGRVMAVAWSWDGNHIAAGSADGITRVWDVQERREVDRLEGEGEVTLVAWKPDGKQIFVSYGTIPSRDPRRGDRPPRGVGGAPVPGAPGFGPPGFGTPRQRFQQAPSDQALLLWDLTTSSILWERPICVRDPRLCQWSPDGTQILFASEWMSSQNLPVKEIGLLNSQDGLLGFRGTGWGVNFNSPSYGKNPTPTRLKLHSSLSSGKGLSPVSIQELPVVSC